MIHRLKVENLAIIERSEILLGAGMTVLTGETGAGKSLFVDAIGLALGARADSTLVRTGAAMGSVEVEIGLPPRPNLFDRLGELGVALPPTSLVIQRSVSAEGRSNARVNEKLVGVGILKSIGQGLVDLVGQHDHQQLMDPVQHLGVLDDWIGAPAHSQRHVVAEAYSRVQTLKTQLGQVRKHQRDRSQRIELLRFQVEEIEAVQPVIGEFEELSVLLNRLLHAEKLARGVGLALTALEEDDLGARDRLAIAQHEVQNLEAIDPLLAEAIQSLETARVTLEDALHEVRKYLEQIEPDPERLQLTADRLDQLKSLRRKYGEDESEILRALHSAREELALLEDSDVTAEQLEANLAVAEAELQSACDRLTAIRKEHLAPFGELVTSELREMAMPNAELTAVVSLTDPSAEGQDAAEFYFTANLGESPKPLARIASGGELSRVMLALKIVLAGRTGAPTLIFDEVDTGLSGRAAALVARKLRRLAETYQVLAISHLPQIAGQAHRHLRIEKQTLAGRVVTKIEEIDGDERVVEIARMLAGEEIGESALANARELIAAP